MLLFRIREMVLGNWLDGQVHPRLILLDLLQYLQFSPERSQNPIDQGSLGVLVPSKIALAHRAWRLDNRQ